MNLHQIGVLRSEGLTLTKEGVAFLIQQSYELDETRNNHKSFKSESFEGWISTEGKSTSLGLIRGIVFKAEIISNSGKTKIDFILDVSFMRKALEQQVCDEMNFKTNGRAFRYSGLGGNA